MLKVKNPKKNAETIIKMAAYLTFFYFGMRFIASVSFLFMQNFRNALGDINLLLSIIITGFGIYLGYLILKKKKWAVMVVIFLIAYNAITIMMNTAYLGNFKFPAVQIAYILSFIIVLKQFRYLKK